MKRPPLFDGAEYARRIGLTRVEMDRRELAALVIVDPANMAWLTGYDGASFEAPQAVVLTLEGAPLWWGRRRALHAARVSAWMADEALFSYPDALVDDPSADPMTDLAGLLKDLGLEREPIGLELGSAYFTAANIGQLLNHLGAATYLDATGLVSWRRSVKSPAEIALMQQAARIVERAHERFFEAVEPGARLSKALSEAWLALIDGASDDAGAFGGEAPAAPPRATAGADTAAARLSGLDAPLAEDGPIRLEIAGSRRRHHCPQSRTLHLGQPSVAIRRAADAVAAALDAAITTARAGVASEAVAEAAIAALAAAGVSGDRGWDIGSSFGGSVGLAYPPDWDEGTVSLRLGDETELAAGMTLHIAPTLAAPSGLVDAPPFGVTISETVLITENGAVPFCFTPRELLVKV